MYDTNIIFQKLNNNDIVFFVGDSPTVTFNDNIKVYMYPTVSYTSCNKINYNRIFIFFKKFIRKIRI